MGNIIGKKQEILPNFKPRLPGNLTVFQTH